MFHSKEDLIEALQIIVDSVTTLCLPEIQKQYFIKAKKVLSAIIISDEKKLLKNDESDLLKMSLFLPFTLAEGFSTVHDILAVTGVKVSIEPGKPKRIIPLGLDKEENCLLSLMSLRGLYDGKEKVIKLFPNVMKDEYKGERMNELLVSTLIHEAMHAYFDRDSDDGKQYFYSVEEPLSEFGMLLYLKETKQEDYYQWALDDVSSKQTRYRYGAALMTQHLSELGKKGSLFTRTRSDLVSYEKKLI